MEYFEAGEKELLSLMQGLNIIERLNAEKASELALYMYGITSDPTLISGAKEAIIENAFDYMDEEGEPTLTEEDIALNEIALAIRLSADTIYALTGSGIDVYNVEFAYLAGEGEGVRDGHFMEARWKRAKVTLRTFSQTAIAEDDTNLRDFLLKSGSGQPVRISKPPIPRTEPAAVPAKPAAPQTPPSGTLNLNQGYDQQFLKDMNITSSLKELVDGFLDQG